MNAVKALLIGGSVTSGLLLATAGLNLYVGPAGNKYHAVARNTAAHPDSEMIVLGSSRGESTSPLWLQKQSGLKTLNLSISGAELLAKTALLGVALEKTKIKKVIWYADYFDLFADIADARVKYASSLNVYLPDRLKPPALEARIGALRDLISRGTIAESYEALRKPAETTLNKGRGSDQDYDVCSSSAYKSTHAVEQQRQMIDVTFGGYTKNLLNRPRSTRAWDAFVETLRAVSRSGISTLIVVPPYHPEFSERLSREHPDIYRRHLEWIADLQRLEIPGLRTLNYFDGIPGDDGGVLYWDDGVHFSCRGVMAMMKGNI